MMSGRVKMSINEGAASRSDEQRKAAVKGRPGESSQGQDRAGDLSLREQSGTICSLTVDGRCRAAQQKADWGRHWKAPSHGCILCSHIWSRETPRK